MQLLSRGVSAQLVAGMAELDTQRQANGIALTGAPVYDQDIYGAGEDRFAGYERSIGLAEEEDERTQAVERWAATPQAWKTKFVLCEAQAVPKVRRLSLASSNKHTKIFQLLL